MGQTHKLTGGTFRMDLEAVLVGEDCSADVCRNVALRDGADPASTTPYERMDYPGLPLHALAGRPDRRGPRRPLRRHRLRLQPVLGAFAPDGTRRDR